MKTGIEVHIDELVLDGFGTVNPEIIREAVSKELKRLLKDRGIPLHLSAPCNYAHTDGGQFTISNGVSGDLIGNHIAAAVYAGIKHSHEQSLFKK